MIAQNNDVIRLEDYSNLDRLLRVSAYVFLFIQRARGRETTLVDMVVEAEQWWVCEAQRCLTKDEKFPAVKGQLNLFQDPQGRWRCQGRIHNANLPYSTRFPIILPNHHHFTRLVILRAHERVFHNGTKETLTEIRSQYWITNGRAIVRKLIHGCLLCRRLEALAYAAPQPPPLPPFRVREAPAFTHVGVDFAGPLYVRHSGSRSEDN